MSQTTARFFRRNTVSVGTAGAVWPFVALDQPGALFFEYDTLSQSLAWCSGNCDEVLGASEQSLAPHGALFLAHLHPSDRFKMSTLLEASLATGVPFVCTYRWIRPDCSETRLLHCRGLLDGDGATFRGLICDLTTESALIRSGGDVVDTVVDALSAFSGDVLVIDSELCVRFARSADPTDVSLGFESFEPMHLRSGAYYPDCFGNSSVRSQVQDLLNSSLSTSSEPIVHEWKGFRATLRPVLVGGSSEGVVIELQRTLTEQRLTERIELLEARARRLSIVPSLASRASDLAQELMGYASMLSRAATRDPMQRHVVEMLSRTTRELGSLTREIASPNGEIPPTIPRVIAEGNRPMPSGWTSVVLASSEERGAKVLSALLRGSGINSIACELNEHDLRETLMQHGKARVLVLDVSSQSTGTTSTVRTIRRYFPALHIVCLVSGTETPHSELQRAGAALVLAKPVAPRMIEKVARSFLALTSSATEAEATDELSEPPRRSRL